MDGWKMKLPLGFGLFSGDMLVPRIQRTQVYCGQNHSLIIWFGKGLTHNFSRVFDAPKQGNSVSIKSEINICWVHLLHEKSTRVLQFSTHPPAVHRCPTLSSSAFRPRSTSDNIKWRPSEAELMMFWRSGSPRPVHDKQKSGHQSGECYFSLGITQTIAPSRSF